MNVAGADAFIGPPFCSIMRNSAGRSGDRPLRFCVYIRFETAPLHKIESCRGRCTRWVYTLIGPPFANIVRCLAGRSGDRPIRFCVYIRFETAPCIKLNLAGVDAPAGCAPSAARRLRHGIRRVVPGIAPFMGGSTPAVLRLYAF